MGRLMAVLLSRLLQAVAVGVAVATLTFAVVNLAPGDLALRIALARHGLDAATPEAVEQVRTEEGLDRPAALRYLVWLGRTLRFDLGRSLIDGRPVSEELGRRFLYTLRLAGAALLASFLIAAPLGVASGFRRGSRTDVAADLVSSTVCAVPAFVLGVLLVLLFSLRLHWLPVAGFAGLRHMVLPALTLAIGLAAVSNRIIANAVADVRARPYYRFARMKGLGEARVFLRHGARNAAVPVLTLLGLQLAHLLDGAIVVETLFAWPGVGRLLLEGILAGDIPVVQGAGILIGFSYVTVNMTVDLLCLALAPRRVEGGAVP